MVKRITLPPLALWALLTISAMVAAQPQSPTKLNPANDGKAAVAFGPRAQEREPLDIYRQRRAVLEDKLNDGLILLFGNKEASGSEAYHVFRQESNFHYLTGYDEPGAVLLLAPPLHDRKSTFWEESPRLPNEILFLPARNAEEERWKGPELDPNAPAAASQIGVAATESMEHFEREIQRFSHGYSLIYTLLPDPRAAEDDDLLQKQNVERLRKVVRAAKFKDVQRALGELRQMKAPSELKLIRYATECTMSGLQAAARELHPGMFEYESAALLKYTFERQGCLGLAFDPIVGSGFRSTILHYTKNSEKMESGDLVVMDVGAEYVHYASDITRTLPVNGHFTERQREIYNIVLGAQQAAMDAVKPGMKITGRGANSLYQIAFDYINRHGKDNHGQPLGKYFIHGLSHHVGLDVHDAGDPRRILEPGMVVTLEPGIYLPEESLGVRIEDMVLVTTTGYELLTRQLPREADEVESWMKK